MDLTETLFQYELKTNKYGKLFFRIYPDDKKEEYLLEFTDKDKDEKTLFKELFFKLYERASNNNILPENIDTSLLTKNEYDIFLEEFFSRQFAKYTYDSNLSLKENFNNAFKFDNEEFKKSLKKLTEANPITRVEKELTRMNKNLGFALAGNNYLENINIQNKIFGSPLYLDTVTKLINPSQLESRIPDYLMGFSNLDINFAVVDSFSTVETALDKLYKIQEPWLGNITNFNQSLSKQLDILTRYHEYDFPFESFELARNYIPDNYAISKISKDYFSDFSIYIKNVEDENEPEYRLNDIKYDKGFIEFLHDVKEKDVIRFLTHLQDFPYLALLDELGKQIFELVQSEIVKYTTTVSNQEFYRARAKEKDAVNWTCNQIGQPQYGVPGMGRFNFLGKPYFYVTSDETTAKKEVESSSKPESTVMKLKQIKDMKIFDISSENCPLVTYCSIDKKDDNDYTAYLVPSFLSVCCAYLNKKQRHSVDAIKYKSIKNKDGFCYVILDKSYAEFFDDGEIVGV